MADRRRYMKKKNTIIAVLAAAAVLAVCSCHKKDYLDEQGLEITPQGEYTFMTSMNDGSEDKGEFEMIGSVSISEKKSPDMDGFKEVSAVFKSDYRNLPEGLKMTQWFAAFDRYTGTSFESSVDEVFDNGVAEKWITIEDDGKKTDARLMYTFENDKESRIMTTTVTVICPEDYDGTVFSIGYGDLEISAKCADTDFSKGPYKLHEMPGNEIHDHDYLYFTVGGK